MEKETLKSIKFTDHPVSLEILNQLLIPHETQYMKIDSMVPGPGSSFSAFEAIKGMYTRGAPAIMLVGCFSVVVELYRVILNHESEVMGYDIDDISLFKSHLLSQIDTLVSSRPTAVNLSNACNEIREVIKSFKGSNLKDLYNEILGFARSLYESDLRSNMQIGSHGKRYIYDELLKENFSGDFAVMTICNTGSLATSGYGTALGIIRALYHGENEQLHLPFKMSHVYSLETRPYNQGSRLTAYELKHDGIPFTLISDSMASFLIESLAGSSKDRKANLDDCPVKFIIVGADRIAKNGDFANKIGTFQLALIASLYPSVKFIVAAPTTTIDRNICCGADIKVELRKMEEFAEVKGAEVRMNGTVVKDPEDGHVILKTVRVAPSGIDIWNPSFDVTPHRLVDAIVTEDCVYTKSNEGVFSL